MNWSVDKIGTIFQEPAHAIGLSTPPIGCVLDLTGLPGAGNKIYDRSPYGNIGAITGAVWKRLPTGLWYLDFDGGDDYVDCGNPESLQITGALTIKAWVKGTSGASIDIIVGKEGSGTDRSFYCSFGVGGLAGSFLVSGDGTNYFTVDAVSDAVYDTWQQLGFVYKPSTSIKILINGVLDNTNTTDIPASLNNSSENLIIGVRRKTGTPDGWFDGGIALIEVISGIAYTEFDFQNSFNREKHLFGVW